MISKVIHEGSSPSLPGREGRTVGSRNFNPEGDSVDPSRLNQVEERIRGSMGEDQLKWRKRKEKRP